VDTIKDIEKSDMKDELYHIYAFYDYRLELVQGEREKEEEAKFYTMVLRVVKDLIVRQYMTDHGYYYDDSKGIPRWKQTKHKGHYDDEEEDETNAD